MQCRIVLILGLSLQYVLSKEDTERATKCGKVPSNEDMMKVVKPMAQSVMHFLPVMEKNELNMAQLFEISEEICGAFDRCYPDGVINDKNVEGAGGKCLLQAVLDGTSLKNEQAAKNVVQSMVESLPVKKKWFFAGMHWVVAMAEVD